MALVTVHAVIDISRDAGMPRIRLGRRVAVRALKHGIVVRVRMARGANPVCIAVVHREPRVVERRPEPTGRRVARGASGWKPCRGVIRIRGALIVRLMARVAICRRSREDPSDVAEVARHVHMRARQRKRRGAVIEGRVQPGRCGVAHGAILRITQGHVIRHTGVGCGVVVVLRVAAVASGRQRPLVIVGVARSTSHGGMRAGEGESRCVVIKGRIQPRRRAMAQRTILREIGGNVVRHTGVGCGVVVVLRVAAVASGRQSSLVIVGVASSTGHCRMGADQRKTRRIVIECGVEPCGR